MAAARADGRMGSGTAAVVVENVSHTYDSGGRQSTVALSDVNLTITGSEFFSLLGPSGCGKSTLLYLIDGLISPTRGRIVVDGSPVRGPVHDRSLVFQEFGLFPWATVTENVEFGLRLRHVPRDIRRRRVAELLKLVKLEQFADRYPDQLSGGMKQRVAFARALAPGPTLLLLDEPLGALDPMTRELMQRELLRMLDNLRLTCILVTHSVDEAIFLSDRVAVFTSRPGRVKEVIPIAVPRSARTDDFRTSTEFAAYRTEIWRLIKNEALESIERGQA